MFVFLQMFNLLFFRIISMFCGFFVTFLILGEVGLLSGLCCLHGKQN